MTNRERRIREIAYQLWEQEGRPEGQSQRLWLAAETQFEAETSGGRGAETSERRDIPNELPIEPAVEKPARPAKPKPDERSTVKPARSASAKAAEPAPEKAHPAKAKTAEPAAEKPAGSGKRKPGAK